MIRWSTDVDRDRLGHWGMWTFDFDRSPIEEIRTTVAVIEELGLGCIWIPELTGREALTHATVLLAASSRIAVANGIARIDRRRPIATAGAAVTLAEAFPGRYLLGLGVGGADTGLQRSAMEAYLDELDDLTLDVGAAVAGPARLLAAYGAPMAELARERTAGVHTYKTTPPLPARIRDIIGGGFLAAEHAAIIETDARRARSIAREHLRPYLASRYNRAKFVRLGYTDDDLAAGAATVSSTTSSHGATRTTWRRNSATTTKRAPTTSPSSSWPRAATRSVRLGARWLPR